MKWQDGWDEVKRRGIVEEGRKGGRRRRKNKGIDKEGGRKLVKRDVDEVQE